MRYLLALALALCCSTARAERVLFSWSASGVVTDVSNVPPGPAGLLCFSENLGKEFRVAVTGYDEFYEATVTEFAKEYNSGWVDMWYDGKQVAASAFIPRNNKRFDSTPSESFVWRDQALLKYDLKPDGFRYTSASVNPLGAMTASAVDERECGLHIEGTEISRSSLTLADVTGDARFNSADLVSIFAAGKYEQDVPATWYEGDWTWDNRFTTADLIAAFRAGAYTSAAVPVPDPSGFVLVLLGLVAIFKNRKPMAIGQ